MTAIYSQKMSAFATTILNQKYAHLNSSGRKETWEEIATRQAREVVRPYFPHLEERIRRLIAERKFIPGGRYLYAVGRPYHQINNCFLFRAEDSREGWGRLLYEASQSLMTGGGVGVVYSPLRQLNAVIKGLGGQASGPCSLAQIINEMGRYMRQGGSRRSALWTGLHWSHPDIDQFIELKQWAPEVAALKAKDFNFPAPMDGTNMSVILDSDFFAALADPLWRKSYPQWGGHTVSHADAVRVFERVTQLALSTGEPGFSIDIGDNDGEHLRNACTEVTSRDDGDMCNLGSLNLSRFNSIEEFMEAVPLGIAFLLCGTLYSQLPVERMYAIREKNRRLGLGVMGVHDWLLQRGRPYGPDVELSNWLDAYALSGDYANYYTDRLGISRPVATRSIAPTGTISIIAETTSGIEPIFAAAMKRRYLDGEQWKAQYIIDATAKHLIDHRGIDPDLVEDAFTLAEDVDRRIQFQAWLQQYVDHGISSTINLPAWGSSINNEATVSNFRTRLLKYLPSVRGITMYPNGARGGQPLNRVSYREAIRHLGEVIVESSESADAEAGGCKTGFCAS